MKPDIRVAVVGCGAIARHAHLPAWLENGNTTVAALCDPDTSATTTIQQRFGLSCPAYTSLDELLARERPDVVDICSPGHMHPDHARRSIEAGCHVLLEKPPAQTTAIAQELIRLALSKGVKVGAIFNYRYRDLVMRLKREFDEGTLGELVKVYITHHGPLIFTEAPWLWNENKSKYLVWEFGIHFFDLLVHLLGPHERVLHVLAFQQPSIGHTTDLEVSIAFANGAVGRLEITADSTRHSTFFTHLQAYGTGMDAFLRWFPPLLRVTSGQLTPMKAIGDELRAASTIAQKLLKGTFLRDRNISHNRTIDAYVEWLKGGPVYSMQLENALPTIRLLEEIEHQIPSYASPSGGVRSREQTADAS